MPLPDLKLRVPQAELSSVAPALLAGGYEEGAIAELLSLFDLSQLNPEHLPLYVWRCQKDGSVLSQLVLLFLLREGLTRADLAKILDKECSTTLLLCGLLRRDSGKYYSTVSLYPCMGQFFATDHWLNLQEQRKGHVYELGLDSYALARLTSRENRSRSLDLCTGSGVHAVASALHCAKSVAVDINPRALAYTEFNAALNGQTVERHLGDLFEPVQGQTFDLITANPPFVPTPDSGMLIHRSPGESGEEVSQRLVEGLSEHLAPDGLFSMILNYPVLQHETYLSRLERWIGERSGWLIALVNLRKLDLGPYIRSHMSPSEDFQSEFVSYLQSYHDLGITHLFLGNVFILRTKPNRANFTVEITTVPPHLARRENLIDWLYSQETYSQPDWRPDPAWTPQQSPYIDNVWRDQDLSKGIIQPRADNWIPGQELNRLQSELLTRLRNGYTVVELKERWREDGYSDGSFDKTLQELGLMFALA